MYDALTAPPKPGTPLESVMILLWQMRQEAEYYLTRVIVQSSIDPDQGKSTTEAWKEFTDHFYPYLAEEVKRGDKAALDVLWKEIRRGGLSVRPLEPLVKSKMAKLRKEATNAYGSNDDDGMPRVRVRKGRYRRRR